MSNKQFFAQRSFFQWLMVILGVFMCGSVFYSMLFPPMSSGVFVIIAIELAISVYFSLDIPLWLVGYVIVTLGIFLLNSIVNGYGLGTGLSIGTPVTISVSAMTVCLGYELDKQSYLEKYVKTVTFLAAISIVFFVLGPDCVHGIFPEIEYERIFWGCPLYVVASMDTSRNYGICTEPGIWQVLLNAAIFILLFRSTSLKMSNRWQNFCFFSLLIAVLTCQSTTGLLNTAALLVISFCARANGKTRAVLIAVIVGLVALSLDWIFNGANSVMQTVFIDKIEPLIASGSTGHFDGSSGAPRAWAMTIGLESLAKSPLTGVGFPAVESYKTMIIGEQETGNALFIMLGAEGLLGTLAIVVPLLVLAWRRSPSTVAYLAFLFFYFNTVCAQSSLGYTPFFILALCCPNVIADDGERRTNDLLAR